MLNIEWSSTLTAAPSLTNLLVTWKFAWVPKMNVTSLENFFSPQDSVEPARPRSQRYKLSVTSSAVFSLLSVSALLPFLSHFFSGFLMMDSSDSDWIEYSEDEWEALVPRVRLSGPEARNEPQPSVAPSGTLSGAARQSQPSVTSSGTHPVVARQPQSSVVPSGTQTGTARQSESSVASSSTLSGAARQFQPSVALSGTQTEAARQPQTVSTSGTSESLPYCLLDSPARRGNPSDAASSGALSTSTWTEDQAQVTVTQGSQAQVTEEDTPMGGANPSTPGPVPSSADASLTRVERRRQWEAAGKPLCAFSGCRNPNIPLHIEWSWIGSWLHGHSNSSSSDRSRVANISLLKQLFQSLVLLTNRV